MRFLQDSPFIATAKHLWNTLKSPAWPIGPRPTLPILTKILTSLIILFLFYFIKDTHVKGLSGFDLKSIDMHKPYV